MTITVDIIRKAAKVLAQKNEHVEAAKEALKYAKGERDRAATALQRAIRGEEPELELQFIDKKTGEVVK